MFIEYNLDNLDKWLFHVNTPFTIPGEHLSIKNDLTLEIGDYFHMFNSGDALYPSFRIEIFEKGTVRIFEVKSTIQTILHNSDLNEEHKQPFFTECRVMYERNETINSILQ